MIDPRMQGSLILYLLDSTYTGPQNTNLRVTPNYLLSIQFIGMANSIENSPVTIACDDPTNYAFFFEDYPIPPLTTFNLSSIQFLNCGTAPGSQSLYLPANSTMYLTSLFIEGKVVINQHAAINMVSVTFDNMATPSSFSTSILTVFDNASVSFISCSFLNTKITPSLLHEQVAFVKLHSVTASFFDCLFSNNTCYNQIIPIGTSAIAAYNDNPALLSHTLTIDACVFDNLYGSSTIDIINYNQLYLVNSTFQNSFGSSLISYGSNINISDGCVFVNNSHDIYPSVVINNINNLINQPISTLSSVMLTMENVLFDSIYNYYGLGGVINFSDLQGTLICTNVTFSNNISRKGTAIYSSNLFNTSTLENFVRSSPVYATNLPYQSLQRPMERSFIIADSPSTPSDTADTQSSTSSAPFLLYPLTSFYDYLFPSFKDESTPSQGDRNIQESDIPSTAAATVNRQITINDCTFENNIATQNGGIFYTSGLLDNLSIMQSNFTNNTSPRGEATMVLLLEGTTQAMISYTTFDNNTGSESKGGAIHVSGNINLDNCYFNGNGASYGGALYANYGNIEINECQFLQNTASIGGGLFIEGLISGTVQHSFIEFNVATYSGGGLYLSNTTNVQFISNLFANNTANLIGGAIVCNSTGATFFDNQIIYSITNGSGAIACIGQSNPIFNETTVSSNTAIQEGAGIYLQDQTTAMFTNSTISFNFCHSSGGGITVSEYALGQINNCTIRNNTVTGNGGGIKANGLASTVFTNNFIFYNKATGDGGGVSVEDQSSTVFDNCEIYENYAISSGGGIAVHGGSTASFLYSSIHHNLALNHGSGCALEDQSNATFYDCSIYMNISPSNGGGFYITDVATGVISRSSIYDNTANSNGGGISIVSFGSPTIYQSSIYGNTAINGGGISVTNLGHPFIYNSTLDSNQAEIGGGIYISDNANITLFDNSLITLNTANASGAGIYLEINANGMVNNSIISHNFALLDGSIGGGIYATDDANVTFTQSMIQYNRASYGGGISTNLRSRIVIQQCTIANNTAVQGGGGIISADLSSPTFMDNAIQFNAATHGGGIMVGRLSHPLFDGNIIEGNTASFAGGGIYTNSEGAPSFINSNTIVDNQALYGGGAYLDSLSFALFNASRFERNQAQSGGAIFSHCSGSVGLNAVFISNSADSGGGIAFYSLCEFPLLYFSNATFHNNSATQGGALAIQSFQSLSGLSTPLPPSTAHYGAIPQWEEGEGGGRGGGPIPIIDPLNTTRGNYTFESCQFINNTAANGGAIFHFGKQFLTTFGPSVLFANNSALQFGGALFIYNSDELSTPPSNPPSTSDLFPILSFTSKDAVFTRKQGKAQRKGEVASPWIQQGSFLSNKAAWGGGAMGISEISSSELSQVSSLCSQCNYTNNTAGYQTASGFATPPMMIQYLPSPYTCPSNVKLINSNFSLGIQVFDGFQTIVKGKIVEENNYLFNVSASSFDEAYPCSLVNSSDNSTILNNNLIQPLDASNGTAYFMNLGLKSAENAECTIQSYSISTPHDPLIPVFCNVSVAGCPSNMHKFVCFFFLLFF